MSTVVVSGHTSVPKSLTAFAGLGALRGETGQVRTFWRHVERYPPGTSLRPGLAPEGKTIMIVSGWACETRILHDGRRQIFAILLPGDAVTLQGGVDIGRRAVVSATRLEVVDVEALMGGEPGHANDVRLAIANSLRRHQDSLLDNMVRIGRLSAGERLLHLFLDLYERLDAVGLVKDETFRIPLTQETIADILGLSIVHINRTLQRLRRDGLISLRYGAVTLRNRQRVAALACFPMAEPA